MRHWFGFVLRGSTLLVLSCALLVASAAPSAAVVTGGCKVQATASKSGGTDLTALAEWHLKNEDVVTGTGSAPSEQTTVQIGAVVFGVAVPVVNSTGNKGTSGSGGPYAVADYSKYGRIISVAGSSDSCSGYVTIIVDDVDALSTAAGAGGLAVGVLGTLGVLATAFRGGRVGGAVFGLLAGLGFGVLLTQTGTLDPRSMVGLALPGGGLVVGAAIAGIFKRRST
jgi:hypothetical protein